MSNTVEMVAAPGASDAAEIPVSTFFGKVLPLYDDFAGPSSYSFQQATSLARGSFPPRQAPRPSRGIVVIRSLESKGHYRG
jgi:hypothetical protein